MGILNTVAGYAIFAGLSLSGLGASTALALTYAIAVPLNFITTGKLVFDSFRMRSLARFLLSYAGIFAINWALLWLAMRFGARELVAQAVIVPFVAILSFLVFKYSVFRKS